MRTSCPECRTTFRVSQDQLGLRRGLVRCGQCNAVFNAYDTLLPELEGAPPTMTTDAAPALERDAAEPPMAPRAQAGDEPGRVQAREEVGAAEGDPLGPEEVLAGVDPSLSILAPQALGSYGARGEPSRLPTADAVAEDESPDAILLSELPNRKPAAGGRQPAWKLALQLVFLLLLGLSLAAQLAYFLRAELAAAVPGARPALEALCRPLDCLVPLPRQLTTQAIVSSSLEHDAEQKSRTRLSFLLANRTNQTQAWPHVVLTLSDVREAPVARKVFAPEEYLPRGVSPRAGFPPQSEQEAALDLDIGNLAATSYVIGVAYP